MSSPVAGSVLSGSAVTFSWTAVTGAQGYWLDLGTTGAGSSNVFNSGAISATSVAVSGIPTNGVNLYATLFTKLNGSWSPTNYIYTESGTAALATMTSPSAGSVLTGTSVTFTWNAGSGPTGYILYVGTTGPGASDVYNSGALATTSATVAGLPTTGAKVYVTLFSQMNGSWKPASYTYTQAGPPTPAAILSPAPSGNLTGTSVTFSWSSGALVAAYSLTLGTTGANSSNLYSSGSITSTSVTVAGLPANGATIYATLSSQIAGAWQSVSYTYTEATPVSAAMISPSPGSVLSGSSATFTWSAGVGSTAYTLYLGTTGSGSSNIYKSSALTGTSVTVSGIPTNGVNLYVTLFSFIGGAWKPVNYVYTQAGTSTLAAMTSPAPGSALTSTTVTFSWSAGKGPTGYILYLGTTGPGSSDTYKSSALTGTSVTVSGLPITGSPLYATLFSQINGAWKPANYKYTEPGPPTPGAMTSPAAGSVLSGSSVKFTWSPGKLVTAYELYVGTNGPGSSNVYKSSSLSGTSATVSGIPSNGVNLYVTLFSQVSGAWKPANYVYTEAGTIALAALTGPAANTVLPGSSATFSWSAGNGPTSYWLEIGTGAPGTSNIFSSGATSSKSITVSTLPTTGAALYVTLFSQINGTWKPASYTFTEAGGASEATLKSISCASSSMTGAGTDTCTVTLNQAAANSGVEVLISSDNSAVAAPAIVIVPAHAVSVSFAASVSAVTTATSVLLKASSDSVTASYSLKLNAAAPGLSLSSLSISFGNVVMASLSTQSLSLTSSGTAPVTINSAVLTGSSTFSISGASFPLTLNPGQTATLEISFNPGLLGVAAGVLTVTSNSSTGSIAAVALAGIGIASTYEVDLNWDAVTGASPAVAGYYVFRGTSTSGSYVLLTASLDTQTAYVDDTVVPGVTYNYYVESVNTAGVTSSPSEIFSIAIP